MGQEHSSSEEEEDEDEDGSGGNPELSNGEPVDQLETAFEVANRDIRSATQLPIVRGEEYRSKWATDKDGDVTMQNQESERSIQARRDV